MVTSVSGTAGALSDCRKCRHPPLVDLPRAVETESYAGGGSLPGMTIPSVALELAPPEIDAFARRARTGAPALVGRTEGGRFLIDLRTIPPQRDEDVVAAVERSRTS